MNRDTVNFTNAYNHDKNAKKQKTAYSKQRQKETNIFIQQNYYPSNHQTKSPLQSVKGSSISKFRRTNPQLNTSKVVSPQKSSKPPLPQPKTQTYNVRPQYKQQIINHQKPSQYLTPLTFSRQKQKMTQTPKSSNSRSKYVISSTQRYFSNNNNNNLNLNPSSQKQTQKYINLNNENNFNIPVTQRIIISPQSKSNHNRININFDANSRQSKQKDDLKSLRSFKSSQKGSVYTSNYNGRTLTNDNTRKQNQSYHWYWKKKAHQYLQMNFKLSQEIGVLKRKLQQYEYQQGLQIQRNQSGQQNLTSNYNSQKSNTIDNNSQSSFIYPVSQQKLIPLHIVQIQQKQYNQTIIQLQLAIKTKDQLIQRLQNKIIQLNNQIKGEHQKSQLLQKLRSQVQDLQKKNRHLDRQHKKVVQINKVYETQKALLEAKQSEKQKQSKIVIKQLSPQKHDEYVYEMFNHRKQRYRSLE